jgi:hydrogenase maturation protein HypF
LKDAEVKTVRTQVENGINLVMTSSAGRLFDVAAAIAGGIVRATYEAQAAIEMEMLSEVTHEFYPYDLRSINRILAWGNGKGIPGMETSCEVGLKPLIQSMIDEVRAGNAFSQIGGKFHRTLARMMAEVSRFISQATGIKKVALSGGCFQNRLLLRMTIEEIQKCGLQPLLHHHVPANDGCVSLGQAAIGHFALKG